MLKGNSSIGSQELTRQSGGLPGYQLVATRCGVPSSSSNFTGTGIASRTQHCLPYGASSLFPVYSGYYLAGVSPDAETVLPGGGGWTASAGTVVLGGTGYVVGDRGTITSPTNNFNATYQIDSVGTTTAATLSILDGGGFGPGVAVTTLATVATTGTGSNMTVNLALKDTAFVAEIGIEQIWGTQVAVSKTVTNGVLKVTSGANFSGGAGNIPVPYGDHVICDPLPIQLSSASLIGMRLYTPGTGLQGGRFLSGTAGLNEYAHQSVTLANNTPYGGTFGVAANPASGFVPTAIMGIPLTPGASFCLVGDSIGFGSVSVSGTTAATTTHDSLDANGNGGFLERAINQTYPFTNFCIAGDQIANWLSQTGATLRMRDLMYIRPSHIIDEMGINDIITGAVSYATFKTYKQAFWTQLLSCGAKEIWATTMTPNPTSTYGVSGLPTISAAGSGYAISSTFNLTVAGGTGTAAVISVTSDGSGTVITVNSVVTIGNYTGVLPTTPNTPTGGAGSGCQLALKFAKCLDQASQTLGSTNTAIQAYNSDLRLTSAPAWMINPVTGVSYISRVIDLGTSVESSVGNGLWVNGASPDAIHPIQAQEATIAATVATFIGNATL